MPPKEKEKKDKESYAKLALDLEKKAITLDLFDGGWTEIRLYDTTTKAPRKDVTDEEITALFDDLVRVLSFVMRVTLQKNATVDKQRVIGADNPLKREDN